jgi:hypothetical protein
MCTGGMIHDNVRVRSSVLRNAESPSCQDYHPTLFSHVMRDHPAGIKHDRVSNDYLGITVARLLDTFSLMRMEPCI